MTSAGAGAVDGVSAARLATVVPALRARVMRILEQLAAEGTPARVTSGRRTQAEQDALYARGRTAPGPVVTWTRRSRHVEGRAVDIVWRTPEGVTWDGPWERWGVLAEAAGLVWGGRWRRPDRPHVELPEEMGDEDTGG
jgi:peptidoglycan L-alanyl-D-glutamate endopeptidase CwlK